MEETKIEIKRLFVGALHTNCYILREGDEACVVDPGGDAEKIISRLSGFKVSKILLTHGHFDHFMAAAAVKEATGARIFVSAEDEYMLRSADASLYYGFTGSGEGFSPVTADEIYSDTVRIGTSDYEVIKTPGHSPGSVSLYCGNCLISGDTLFAGAIGKIDPSLSYDDIMRSVWKLMLLDDEVRVHPGHGFSTTIGKERNENPFLR